MVFEGQSAFNDNHLCNILYDVAFYLTGYYHGSWVGFKGTNHKINPPVCVY